jgi:hypothetical protein
MKNCLRETTSIVVVIGALALPAGSLFLTRAVADEGGTDILHLFDHTVMTNNGVETNAAGHVDVRQNTQGHADNQSLEIKVRGLETNSPYQVWALVDNDTNSMWTAQFSTDSDGDAALNYRKLGHGDHGGHDRLPLPAVLDPVSEIRQLTIANASTQAVLTADLTMPNRLQYLIKRNLSAPGIEASLRIHATTTQTQFRLVASGLSPTNNYFLALNGGIVETNSTNLRGRLVIRSLLVNPTDILDVHSVAVLDSSSNTVVSTTLP